MARFDHIFVTFETDWILPEAWPAIVEFEMTVNGDQGRLHYDGIKKGFELSSDKQKVNSPSRMARFTWLRMG